MDVSTYGVVMNHAIVSFRVRGETLRPPRGSPRVSSGERGAPRRGTKLLRCRDAECNECNQHDSLCDGERRLGLGGRQRVEEWHLLKGLDYADEHVQVEPEPSRGHIDPTPRTGN